MADTHRLGSGRYRHGTRSTQFSRGGTSWALARIRSLQPLLIAGSPTVAHRLHQCSVLIGERR
jgi:hypothetical protein